ncbi:MAG: indolepyruvate ferredoxin oxidoreductase subunit alpha [Bacillota bacterium]
MRKLMTGNEALARGAYEAGCAVATAYPGTPSTEILENIAKYKEIYSQWSTNEKVAVEIACGASFAGARSLSAMKVVGLNVAMDPIMNGAYLGVRGGLIIVVADDPSCTSSQNEQDNRLVAPFGKLPLIEPSNSQECKDFIKYAFELSEEYDVPILFRMTTRVCHSKSVVELGERVEVPIKEYKKTDKYLSSPQLARKNHARLEKMVKSLGEFANSSPINKIEWGQSKEIGIVTSGMSYQHAKEVFGDSVSYLKLGLSYPFPQKLVQKFAKAVGKLYVIEENEPYLENNIKQMGIECIGKEFIPAINELTPKIIKDALLPQETKEAWQNNIDVPNRPPMLCAGCPHRPIFYVVSKYKDVVAANDIGCYTLGMAPPLNVTDALICMGGGITLGIGFEKAFRKSGQKNKVFGFMGDSTFFHSGITGLIDAVWNKSNMVICILDNRTTAMTGHQENPGTGKTLMGEESPVLDIEQIVKASGVKEENIRIVDAYNFAEVEKAVKDGYESNEVFVIITKRPCALIKEVQKQRRNIYCTVDSSKCTKCKICIKTGCPAIAFKNKEVVVNRAMCNGCGLCQQVCKFNAIIKVGE